MSDGYKWRWFASGAGRQVELKRGEDLRQLAQLDRKQWMALSMPTKGVRFDARTLELLDTDGDGRVRSPEILAAIAFLKARGVDLDSLFHAGEAEERELAKVMEKQAALAAAAPTAADREALAAWEAKGREPAVAVLGEATAAAEAALKAVEAVVDDYFHPTGDLPLVVEETDRTLPLKDHISPRHIEAVLEFGERCVVPLLGARERLTRFDYKRIKAALTPYREWLQAKPVVSGPAKAELDDEERVWRYRLHLVELLENFVNLRRLYAEDDSLSIVQTGVLRLDAKGLNLCLHVEDEAAHSALVGKSKCCVVYARLTRKGAPGERRICAVVTAGTVDGLYVGRNGVFYDRDGTDWEATVTKVVESQVSLTEAFWAPWRKLGELTGDTFRKFLGDRQKTAMGSLAPVAQGQVAPAPAPASGNNGAAMASSVAAIGIGVGLVGAACASVMAAVSRMTPAEILLSVVGIFAAVSLPSVLLTWLKLRQRDLGAILNASGWAVNRQVRFSMRLASSFTRCASDPRATSPILWTIALVLWGVVLWLYARGNYCC